MIGWPWRSKRDASGLSTQPSALRVGSVSSPLPPPGGEGLRESTLSAALAVGLVCLFLAGGCGTSPQTTREARTHATGRQLEESLEAVSGAFRKAPETEDFRNALQRLNTYLARHPGDKPRAPSREEQAVLTQRFGLDAGSLNEIGSDTFTALDARYLDVCFLLSDAARSLRVDQLPPLEQATAAFGWVMRQIRPRQRAGGGLVPAEFALRWGWGTGPERALVFLALLQQLGIDGCMVAVPGSPGQTGGTRPWAVGVLVGKEIYLFDPRLGLPVPGPGGKGIATLAQVRTQPALLGALTVDPQLAYDISPQQAQQAEVYVAAPLSALAPRMQKLQEVLEAGKRVRLWVEPVGLLGRWEAVARGPAGGSVRVWRDAVNALRSFLPPDEGGTDTTHQRDLWMRQLIAWQYLPVLIQKLPGEPGQRLQQSFSRPFIYFSLQARMPRELLLAWLPGLAQGRGNSLQQGERQVSEVVLREHMPRDLVLRGRYDEATTLLVAIRDELTHERDQAKQLLSDPQASAQLKAWADQAVKVYGTLLQVQEQARKGTNPAAAAAVAQAQDQVQKLWNLSGPIFAIVLGAAAEPLLGEVIYELALCKHEQAERARISPLASAADKRAAPGAWRSAAGWWKTYLEEQPDSAAAPSARRLRAEALAALGKRTEAAALLQNLAGPMTPLEKTASLYLAQQLRRPEDSRLGKRTAP